jgi:transposase
MSKKETLRSTPPTASVVRRGPYPKEFQREAVRLVTEEKYSFTAAAAAVNVCEKSLRDWHAKFAPKPAPCGEDASLNELREENKRLRKQLQRAELEREILKKATAYFAKESL